MKLLRILGGFLFGLGCIAALIGLLALLLPMVENDQLKLVLASFETPSDNAVVSVINTIMSYALHNCYIVMLAGAGSLMIGVVMMLLCKSAAKPEAAIAQSSEDSGAQAYTVAGPDTSTEDIPVWKQGGKTADKANPYASAAKDMLKPDAKGGVTETTTNPFAPRGETDAKDSSAYKRPDGDDHNQADKPGKRKSSADSTASGAGDAEHLFDLIRRYGAEKEDGADDDNDDGVTVTVSSRDSAEAAVERAELQEAAVSKEEREKNTDTRDDNDAAREQSASYIAVRDTDKEPERGYDSASRQEREPTIVRNQALAFEPAVDTKRELATEAAAIYAATPDTQAERPEPYGRQAYYAPRYEAGGAAGNTTREAPRDIPYPEPYGRQAYYAPRYETGGARDMPRGAYREAPRESQRYPGQSAAMRQPSARQTNAPTARPSSAPPQRPAYRSAEAGKAPGSGAMRIPKSIQLPAAHGTEETIYRAPSFRPDGGEGRPRIRSTFPASRQDGSKPAVISGADRITPQPKASEGGVHIISSVGKRDL